MFRKGARDALPMAIGIAAWGLVAGVAMAGEIVAEANRTPARLADGPRN